MISATEMLGGYSGTFPPRENFEIIDAIWCVFHALF